VVTVPLPFLLMLILKDVVPPPPPAATRSKFAVTLFSPVMVKVHVAWAPIQSPDHAVNVELLDGLAVSVVTVPSASGVVQVPPQLIFPLVTVDPDTQKASVFPVLITRVSRRIRFRLVDTPRLLGNIGSYVMRTLPLVRHGHQAGISDRGPARIEAGELRFFGKWIRDGLQTTFEEKMASLP
jgi:hypothetical protein